MGQRLTGMSANQAMLPMAGSIFPFHQHDLGCICQVCMTHDVFTSHRLQILFMQFHWFWITHGPAVPYTNRH